MVSTIAKIKNGVIFYDNVVVYKCFVNKFTLVF